MFRDRFYIQMDSRVENTRNQFIEELRQVCNRHGAKLSSLKGLNMSNELITKQLLSGSHTDYRGHARKLYGFDKRKVFLM